MPYLFFALEQVASLPPERAPSQDLRVEHWRPRLRSIVPPGCGLFPFGIWWLFHLLGVFSNRGYSVLLIYDGDDVVHRSCVFPRFFRLPFMSRTDLQVGDTFTRSDCRGRGLAVRALREIAYRVANGDRTLWYVVSDENQASVRVAKKAGFHLVGVGSRKSRFGLRILGYYCIDKTLVNEDAPTCELAGDR